MLTSLWTSKSAASAASTPEILQTANFSLELTKANGTGITNVVFIGPERTKVGFVRVRTLECMECLCEGPQSTTASRGHMVGLETTQPPVMFLNTKSDFYYNEQYLFKDVHIFTR